MPGIKILCIDIFFSVYKFSCKLLVFPRSVVSQTQTHIRFGKKNHNHNTHSILFKILLFCCMRRLYHILYDDAVFCVLACVLAMVLCIVVCKSEVSTNNKWKNGCSFYLRHSEVMLTSLQMYGTANVHP